MPTVGVGPSQVLNLVPLFMVCEKRILPTLILGAGLQSWSTLVAGNFPPIGWTEPRCA